MKNYGSFNISAQNIDCGYLLKPPRQGGSTEYPQSMFLSGYTGSYIDFLISVQNIDCGYLLEPPRRGGSTEYPQSMFLSRNKKINV